jgi:hypothetical protein
VVSGSTLSFTPSNYAFAPGETVFSTITTAAQASTGGALAQPRVQQFTAAVGGTGRGNFVRASTVAVPDSPSGMATGDVDGDGDLDLVVANTAALNATVLLNSGSGTYTIASTMSLPERPFNLALGDVDGDGDLDAVLALYGPGGNKVSTRLNGGNASGSNTGVFGNGSDVVVGDGPAFLALGDVDGDGDLDVAVTINGPSSTGSTVRVCLNGGNSTGSNTGIFSNGSSVTVGLNAFALALGDVDNDGDLDLAASTDNGVKISLNAGNGTFSGGSTVAMLYNVAQSVALADLNGDNYLDLLSETSVRLNTANGSGTFGGGSDPLAGTGAIYTTAADVDADGDLDLVAALALGGTPSMSVRLNNGAGVFGGGSDVNLQQLLYYLVAADLDGDGDVDIATASSKDTPSLSILLNDPAPVPTIGSFTPTNGVAGTRVVINGTNLGGASAIAFGGTGNNTVTSGYTVNAAGTQITGIIVPGGAQTGPISVTTPGGTATSTTSFTVPVPVPVLTNLSLNSGPVGTAVTLTGSNFLGTTGISFNGTPALAFSVTNATTATATVPTGATTGPVILTTAGGPSNSLPFTVTSPSSGSTPTITLFGLTKGPVGAIIKLTGTNFLGATSVTFNGTAAQFTVINATTVTATVPVSATSGPLSLTTPAGTATSADRFTVGEINLCNCQGGN